MHYLSPSFQFLCSSSRVHTISYSNYSYGTINVLAVLVPYDISLCLSVSDFPLSSLPLDIGFTGYNKYIAYSKSTPWLKVLSTAWLKIHGNGQNWECRKLTIAMTGTLPRNDRTIIVLRYVATLINKYNIQIYVVF